MALWLAWTEAFFGFLIAHNLFSREVRGIANGRRTNRPPE